MERVRKPTLQRIQRLFTETYTRVNNVPKLLKDVTESDMDEMNDDEYVLFEELFIQLYLGQWKSDLGS